MMEKDRYLSVFICFIGSSWQSESWVAGGSSRVFFVLFCCWVWFFVCFLCLFLMAWVGRDPKGHNVPTSLPQTGPPTSRSGTRPEYTDSVYPEGPKRL